MGRKKEKNQQKEKKSQEWILQQLQSLYLPSDLVPPPPLPLKKSRRGSLTPKIEWELAKH